MDDTIDINNMPVAYSPNMFFYQAVDQSMTPPQCVVLDSSAINQYTGKIFDTKNQIPYDVSNINILWGQICKDLSGGSNADTITQCYQHELCKNNTQTQLIEKTNVNHSGSNKRYLDTKMVYNLEYLTLGNLLFGIVKLIVINLLIYYNK
jgi:hypothetical protein